MVRKIMKTAAVLLLAVSVGIGMSTPQVSAAVRSGQTARSARYIEPEEWNRSEIMAYQFDSETDFENYALSGGTHLYNKNYKGNDHFVKIKVVDPGILNVQVTSEGKEKIPLYDASKKKVLIKDLEDANDTEGYVKQVQAGDEFYVKLPQKISKVLILAGVYKDGFTSMTQKETYYTVGKGTKTYHTFKITKRAEAEFNIWSAYKKDENISVEVEKYTDGKWTKVGSTAKVKSKAGEDEYVGYGLQKGKYRLVLTIPKGQIIAAFYTQHGMTKDTSYKKSKAKNVKDVREDIYTEEESAPRWYKVNVKSSKKKRELWLTKESVGGGFKFSIYKDGQKKAIKTVKATKGETFIVPLKKKGTYYIKVSKLTKKTNGRYIIENYEN